VPTIQNRSRFIVSVAKHLELRREFPFNKQVAITEYIAQLKAQGFKPALKQAEDSYEVRFREKGAPKLTVTCHSAEEVQRTIDRITSERSSGLFVDYRKGLQTTFADLIRKYLTIEAPKHKSWEMEAYKLNGLLRDAGCEPVSLAEILKKTPFKTQLRRTPNGAQMRESATVVDWVHKPFGKLMPDDFHQYIEERLESVMPATVDREIDLFSAICRKAILTWRVPIQQSPMDGLTRPKYFNERDRRLKASEWERLLDAARYEDREQGIDQRLEDLMTDTREIAADAATVYAKKGLIKDARALLLPEAEHSFINVAMMETFVHFQVMTAARRSETLNLTWKHVDLDAATAYLPETKNGRPRTLPLRRELVDLLRQMPRSGERVFPITTDYLRKAWARMCDRAKLVDLHIHDLRHEGISQAAETGRFSLIDLQAFSGHRDPRMLMRYTHLCASQLADRLDAAFATNHQHKGRRRVGPGTLPLAEALNASRAELGRGASAPAVELPAQTLEMPEPATAKLGTNVIRFPFRTRAA
jgi:integrase